MIPDSVFTQPVIQRQRHGMAQLMNSQQPQGSAPVMMHSQLHQGSAHAIMPHQQFQDCAQAIMQPQQLQGAPLASMTPQQALTFAHSVMSSDQFLAFAQAMVQPKQLQVSSPIMSPHQFQGPTLLSSLPQFHGSTPVMSPQQVQGPTQLISPQQSESPTQAMMAPHEVQGPSLATSDQQPEGSTQSIIPYEQSQSPAQLPMGRQHGDPPDPRTFKGNRPAPYRGIVPPAKITGQITQLGMMRKSPCSPLSPVVSPKHRVVKNTVSKHGVHPQFPPSPVSPPEIANIAVDKSVIEDTPMKANMAAQELDAIFEPAFAGDEVSIICPDVAAEVDALFVDYPEDADVSLNSPEVPAKDVPAKEVAAKEVSAKAHNRYISDPFMNTLTMLLDDNTDHLTQPDLGMLPGYNFMPLGIYDVIPPSLDEPASTSSLASPEYNAPTTEVSPENLEMAVASPEVEDMTIEEQYAYGIRQGLPNKRVPEETVLKELAAMEHAAEKTVPSTPVPRSDEWMAIMDKEMFSMYTTLEAELE